jgi:hypothetical protein
MSKDEVILSEDQKVFILANYTKMSLKELAQAIGNDPKQNGQTKLGRAIREFLGAKGLEYETTKFVKQGDLVLTKEQIEFIDKNKSVMKPLEMAKLLFSDEQIEPLGREFRAVYKYVEESAPTFIPKNEKIVGGDYKPPASIARLIPRVNKYIFDKDPDKQFINPDNVKKDQLRNLQALLTFLSNKRFIYQACQYTKEADIELFEGSFIEFLYAKPDCIEEDIHNYISLCSEIVNVTQMERMLQVMDQRYFSALTGESEEKITQTLSDAMDKLRAKMDSAKKRYDNLMKVLVDDRAKREENRQSSNATILNLVGAVREEEARAQLLEIAKKQKMLESNEVDNLANMDRVIALIAGFDKNKAKNG